MSNASSFPPDDSPNPFARPLPDNDPALNPYAPTSDVGVIPAAHDDVESYRYQYLKHEASVRSLGLLYLIPGTLLMIGAVVTFLVLLASLLGFGAAAQSPEDFVLMVLVVGGYGSVGGLYLYTGVGLRRFWPSSRIIGSIFSVLGLLAIPIGTLISAYFLYLLASEKGRIVFSESYQDAIRQTPHIKYKTPALVKWLAGLLLLVIAALITLAVLGG